MQPNKTSYFFSAFNHFHGNIVVNFYSERKHKITAQLKYDLTMNEEAKNLARNLIMLMDHYGDTQQDLHKRSGVAQKTISNMRNPGDDRAPNLDNVAKVAAAYKLKTWHLLLPNATLDILLNLCVEKLMENYMAIDKESRETVLRVTENAARYETGQNSLQIKK